MTSPSTANPSQPPAQARVVIIGGGVVGVCAALHLAERGISVVLCEKGRIAGEQSSRNWGWIRRQGRAVEELPLMQESLAQWTRIAAQLDDDIGFRVGGISYIAETEKEMDGYCTWLNDAKHLVPDAHLLDRGDANKLAGRQDQHFIGALLTSGDAYAEPALAVPSIARLAAKRGAKIFDHLAVRGLERQGGKVAGVVTERGSIKCDAVILAGGAWSRSFMENEGLAFAQLAVLSSVLRTSPVPPIAPCTLGAASAALRPRADGGYTVARTECSTFELIPAAFTHLRAFMPILLQQFPTMKLRAGRSFFGPLGRHRWQLDETSPYELTRTLDPAPDQRLLTDVMKSARTLFPALADAKAVETWAGMIDVTPDEIAVISPVDTIDGLILASGMSGHGFGLGPGAGLLAAQMAIDEQPVVDPTALSLSRFQR